MSRNRLLLFLPAAHEETAPNNKTFLLKKKETKREGGERKENKIKNPRMHLRGSFNASFKLGGRPAGGEKKKKKNIQNKNIVV